MKTERNQKMRRVEFQVEDAEAIDAFLKEMSYGFLGTLPSSRQGRVPANDLTATEDSVGRAHSTNGPVFPEVTPLNYVFVDGRIYFHGSRVGRKMQNLKDNAYVTFVVAREFAIIPSYFMDTDFACPATAFFKSVTMRGTAAEVHDLDEKVRALSALMQKLQPEGGYRPFDLDDPEYRKNVKGVCVVRIDPMEVTAKFKFGQNRKGADWDNTRAGLDQRKAPMDAETIALMEKYCPAHRKSDDGA